jgi:hypothetical protein
MIQAQLPEENMIDGDWTSGPGACRHGLAGPAPGLLPPGAHGPAPGLLLPLSAADASHSPALDRFPAGAVSRRARPKEA